jgi:Xaa-Pro aminopeptidase
MADARLETYLEQDGGDVLLTADPGLVRMLTGHVADIESGPSPFALPPIAVAPADGEAVLVCSSDDAPDDGRAETYVGFTIGPLDVTQGAQNALRRALARAGRGRRRLLVDTETLPAAACAMLDAPKAAGAPLRLLGAVKRPDEVDGVSRAIAACDAGQAAARGATVEGADELAVWSAARAAIERAAGGRVAVIADLVSGERTAEVGGPPTGRALSANDLVLCDLVPRVDGLWGDSCATWAVGAPAPKAAEVLHGAARAALTAALDRVRVGAVAGDVDAAARAVLADAGIQCPHHIGHGVGFRWHEEPRIVPGSPTVLAEGMVVALEPGGYHEREGVGVRVEVVAVVEPDGPRVLSAHDLELAHAPVT